MLRKSEMMLVKKARQSYEQNLAQKYMNLNVLWVTSKRFLNDLFKLLAQENS